MVIEELDNMVVDEKGKRKDRGWGGWGEGHDPAYVPV
jgi:hypothetical protein